MENKETNQLNEKTEETKEEEVSPEFSINNLEVVRAANCLDLKYDDLTEREVFEKLELIWKHWYKEAKSESFYEYVRNLNSKLGYKPGIHPLDKIYTYLVVKKETKDKKSQEDKIDELKFKEKIKAIIKLFKEI